MRWFRRWFDRRLMTWHFGTWEDDTWPNVSLLHSWCCTWRAYVTLLGHDVTPLGFYFM
jgi:hypothetical protein